MPTMRYTQEQLNHFAGAFRRWREDEDLTQLEAADRLGVSQRTVQEWEAGHSVPSPVSRGALRAEIGEEVVAALADTNGDPASLAQEVRDLSERVEELLRRLDG